MKGPRPCLGHLGKGDWPLSTRAYPHRDTHLLTYTCWHTCNRPSTNSAASSSLSLSLLFALFLPPSIAVLRSQNPLSLSLSRYEPHLCALYPPPPPFSHVYRTRLYFINAPRFFQPKLLASFYDLTRADGLNNSGECTALLSFFRVNVAGYCSVTWDGRGCGRK